MTREPKRIAFSLLLASAFVFGSPHLSIQDLEANRLRIAGLEEMMRHAAPSSRAKLSSELARLRRPVEAGQARQSFIVIEHCLLVLVAAGCGGLVAGWFYDRREKASASSRR